jgi:hypothetical protein
MIVAMSETTTSSSEPATGPVAAAPPPSQAPTAPPHAAEPPRRSRLTAAAAWVGIVAGVVFIVAVVFFSGFIVGSHTGGHRGFGHHGDRDRDFAIIHRGPPPMFPVGPRGEFERPAPPFGPGFQPPGAPTTTAPSRP